MLNKTTLLFSVILIEGYVVLACELLAIRQLVPFVGSGTEVVSIVISAVLLPLAIGYHYGGIAYRRKYARSRNRGETGSSIRKVLLRNIVSALFILTLGLSYVCMEAFFTLVEAAGLYSRLGQAALYSMLFLVTPVFMLGQTVPLVSNYFSRRRLSEVTGKMLFFSTVGSFLGSVFSTIVLMSFIGVHNTVIVTLGLLCFLLLLLAHKSINYETICSVLIFIMLWALNNNEVMQRLNIISNNAYNIISLEEVKGENSVILNVNRSASSKLAQDPEDKFGYIKFIEKNFYNAGVPLDILVLGAGGFTIGLEDRANRYTFVDIDKDLKDVSEKYFLKQELGPNKIFVAMSARAFLRNHDKKYDLILIDVYTNIISMPMETTTREFLLDVKKVLKPNGVLISNVICHPTFQDKFTVRYTNTFASVFPTYSRQIIYDFTPWYSGNGKAWKANVLYIYFDTPFTDDRTIYTDDKNTYSLDVGLE
jgi:hypothetical protein